MLALDNYKYLLVAGILLGLLLLYGISHISIIPQHSKTFSLLCDDGPIHLSSVMSPFSQLRGRLQWRRLAHSKKMSSGALAAQILDDQDPSFYPTLGTPVSSFNRVVIWDKHCLDDETLDSWSRRGDALADNALLTLGRTKSDEGKTKDTLLRIMKHTSTEKDDAISALMTSADRRPPIGCGAINQAWYDEKPRSLADEMAEEKEILSRARIFFFSNGTLMFVCLLHVALVGGFASPRIIKVLKGTGYIMSSSKNQQDKQGTYTQRPDKEAGQALMDEITKSSQQSKDRVYRRLLETLQFMLDIMEDDEAMLPPSMGKQKREKVDKGDADQYLQRAGVGWLAATRVRLLHAGVRKRLCLDGINGNEEVVPISQDELVATLGAFSVAPLWSLDRMGLTPTPQQRSDYVSLWRHVGYYMGIEPQILSRTFRDIHSAERAYACEASYHFRNVDKNPAPPMSMPTYDLEAETVVALQGPALPLLHSVAGRPFTGVHISMHIAVTRYLLGDTLSNTLYLPKTSMLHYLYMQVLIASLIVPALFVKYYPRKAWIRRRAQFQQKTFRQVLDTGLKEKKGAANKDDAQHQSFFEPNNSIGSQESKQRHSLLIDNILLVIEEVLVCALILVLAFTPFYLAKEVLHSLPALLM